MIEVILKFQDAYKAEPVADLLARYAETLAVRVWPDAGQDVPEGAVIVTDDLSCQGRHVIHVSGDDIRLGGVLDAIKRSEAHMEAADIAIGDYMLDVAEHALVGAAQNIRLTEKESFILQALAAGQGDVVGRDDLLARVWGYGENIETHTLETHIYRLRQKIERDPAEPQILLTAENGYRLG